MTKFLRLLILPFLFATVGMQAQTFMWADNGGANFYDYANDTEVDSDGNMVVTGYWYSYNAGFELATASYSGSFNSLLGSYVISVDEDGNDNWAAQIMGNGNGSISYGYALAEAVDIAPNDGSVLVSGAWYAGILFGSTGTTSPTSNSYEGFVVKYDSAGSLQWYKTFKGPGYDHISSVSSDNSGNIYILGRFEDSVSVDSVTVTNTTSAQTRYYVAKFNASGTLQWINTIESGDDVTYSYLTFQTYGYRYGKLLNLSTSENEDVIVTGAFYSSATIDSTSVSSSGSTDIFLARLDADDGSLIWLDRAGGTGLDWPNDMVTDDNDNFYLVGMGGYTNVGFDSNYLTNTGYKGFLAKYNDNGNCSWVIGSNGNTSAYSNSFTSVGLDDEGNAYVGGKFAGTLTLGSYSLIGANTQSSFVAQYDMNTSAWNWIEGTDNTFSSNSNNVLRDLSVRSKNDIFGAGYFRDDVQFGDHQLSNGGNDFYADAYIFRTADCSQLVASAFTIGNDTIICDGEDIEVYADTNSLYDYQWLYNGAAITGEINDSYTVDDDGNYSVIVDSAGCIDTSNIVTISVSTPPNVTHPSIPGVCDGEDPFQLTGGNPSGGWYTGDPIVGGDTFDPSLATLGNNQIWYVYANAFGCADSVSKNVNVYQTPAVFTTSITACEGDAPISLSGAAYGFPTGGSHSGPGVSGNQFDPGVAGPGSHGIYYTASNGCTATDSIVATVTASPNVNLNVPSANACATSSTPIVLTGTPSGGTFTWNSINSQLFYPSLAGTGNVMVTYSVTQSGCTAVDTDYIFVDTVPTVSIATLPTLCEGDDTLGLAPYGSPSGGTFSGTGISANVFSPTSAGAGTFTVTYSYTNGCGTYTDTESITVGESPSLSMSSTDVSCNGGTDGTAGVSASGGSAPYDYEWSNGGNTATLTGLSAGTYTVTVTDNNGCEEVGTVMVDEPTLLSVALNSSSVSCNGGSNGNVSAFPSGGTSPYTYLWSEGSTSAIVTGLGAGTYSVVITDANSCQVVDSVTVTEPTPVLASISSSTDVSCNGGSNGSATASGSGGTPGYTYAWSGGGSAATKTGLSAGTYTVSVTDASGCTDTETVSISEPSAVVASITSSNDVSCNGGSDGSATASGSGGTPGYTYAWTGGGSSATKSGLSAGTYTVTVTDANGCEDTETVTIGEPATSVSVSITASTDVSCNGGNDGSATASASGGTGTLTYAWSGGAGSSATATSLSAGTYTVTATDVNGCSDTAMVTINEPSAVVASISSSTNVSCNGGNDGQATASGSGGTPGYTYAWSGGGSSATKTGLSAGTYTVTVTDANGCEDTETVTISAPSTLVASISSSTNVSCNGGNNGQATASGSGGTPGYTYAWSGGGSAATKTGLSAGTYTVTVTDVNGCSDTAMVSISEPSAVVASITSSNDVSCNGGSDGSATASGSGGTPGYTYAWTGGGSSATKSGLSAGTYTVTVTDANGCEDTETVTIGEPATSVSVSITASTDVSCNGGNDGSATASASGGTGTLTYAWSGGAGSSATATSLSAGTYTVTATDVNGCSDTAMVTINEPSAVVASISSSINVSCNGGNDGQATASGSGGTPGYTYAWSGGGSSATKTGLSAGTYTVTVTDANGCEDTETVTISAPSTLVASISSSTNVSCNGGNNGQATASGSGGTPGYTYAWSGGGSSATKTGLSAGTYTVTVTDVNGCSDTAMVSISEPSAVVASITSSNDVSCNGGSDGSATASGSGGTPGYTYAWTGGGSSATKSGLSAGTYTVTVTDANGCEDTETVTIGEPATSVSVSITASTDVSCNGGNDGSATASASGGTGTLTYAWSGGAGSSATATSLSAGTYTVTATDVNGCSDTAMVTINEPSAVVASISSSTNVSCNGGNDGQATASGSGGTPGYTYAWSGGGSSATKTGLSAGTYTVTVTDANGCEDTEEIVISEPASVNASISTSTNVSCNGGSDGAATAGGSGGTSPYTYSWSNSATTDTISGLSAGTYSVTVTDVNGCFDSTSVVISEPSPTNATIVSSSDVSCNGLTDGSATASGSGGTSPYTYVWSSGSNSATATGLAAGTFTVTVTDANGCTQTATVTISEPSALSSSLVVDNNVSCNGGADGAATVTASGGTPGYDYIWSSGETTASASSLQAGMAYVTVTDTNGCSMIDSISITEPASLSASIPTSTNVSCFGGSDGTASASASGGTSPYSYAWSTGGTASSTTGLSAGMVTVVITDANGCVDSASVSITEPTSISLTLSATDISCNGANDGSIASTVSGGTPGYTYLWSTGSTASSISGLSSGTYGVTVTDANGCTINDSETINEPSALIASAALNNDVSCNGGNDGSVTASASGGTSPYTYLWNNADTSASSSGLMAGTFSVTITDANGCVDSASVTVSEPTMLMASITLNSNATCAGTFDGEATGSGTGGTVPYTYLWSTSATTATASGLPVGTHCVTVTDANGCTDTSCVTIVVEDTIAPTVVTQNITADLDSSGVAIIDATMIDNGSSDACGIASMWLSGDSIFDCSDTLSTHVLTLYVEDVNGNIDSATAVVTVQDVYPPTALINYSVQLYLDANGEAVLTASMVDTGSFDNCAIADSILAQELFTCADVGNNWIGYQVVDVSGNMGVSSVLVQVYDTLAPVVTTQNITAYLDATGNVSITAPMLDNGSYDSCGVDSLYLSKYDFDCADLGSNSVTLSVVDVSGNVGSASATVTVLDTVGPMANSYSTLNLYLDSAGQASLTVSMVDSASTDACGIDTMYIDQETFDCFDASTTTTVTLMVIDVSGNTSSATTSVSVWDTMAPIALATDTTLFVDVNGQANLTALAVDNGTSDNCALDSIYLSQDEFDCGDIGSTLTITFFAVDIYGNIGQTAFNVTVLDTMVPTVSTQNTTVYLDAAGSVTIDTTFVNNNSFDNCALDTLWLSRYDFSCVDTVSPQSIWLYAMDESGNIDSSSAQVIVIDSMTPVLNVTDTTLFLDSTGNVTLSASAAGVNSFDNCAISSEWLSDSTFSCADTGVNVVTYYAMDGSGNLDSVSFNVTVIDSLPPTVNTYASLDLYLAASGNVTLTAAMVDSATTDNCALDAWGFSQSLFDCSDLGTNTVSITVTDVSGNVATSIINVNVFDTITNLSVSMDSAILCHGGSNGVATASAAGFTSGYTYLWSDAQTTATATGLSAGTYYVTATSSGGCEIVDSITFIEPAGMSANLTAMDVTCFGGADGYVSVTVSGGTSGYAYEWSNGGLTDSIGGLSSGTYTVTITDANGCEFEVDTTITSPTQLVATIQSSVGSLCTGDSSAVLTVDVTGGTPGYDLIWDVGYVSTQDTITNLPAGVYYVAVSDSVGCITVDSITILENLLPGVSFDIAEDTVCAGTLVSLSNVTPTGGTYTGNGISGDTLYTTNLLGNQYITYSYSDSNGCGNSATDTIHILPQAEISFLSDPIELCIGQSLDLTFASPLGGFYTSPFIQDSMLVAPDTLYTGVGGTYTFQNACGTDTAEFNILVHPLPEVDLGNDTLLCNANQLKLDAGTQNGYLWSTGATSQSILINNGEEPLTEDVTVWVEVYNAQGCASADTITIDVEDQPIFYLGDNIEACLDSVITLSVPNVYDNFLWSDSSTSTSIIAHDGSIKAPGAYAFWVVGWNSSGCSYTDTLYIRLEDCDSVFVGVDELTAAMDFSFYPNPAHENVNLVLGEDISGLDEVNVYGSLGELVRTYGQADWNSQGQEGEVMLELGDLPSGVYLIQVSHQRGTLTKRMIIGR